MGPWGNPVIIKHPCKDFPPTAVCYSEIMKRDWKTWKFYHTWVCEEDKYAIFCYRFLIYEVIESCSHIRDVKTTALATFAKDLKLNRMLKNNISNLRILKKRTRPLCTSVSKTWLTKKTKTCCMGIFTCHNVHPTLKISAKKNKPPLKWVTYPSFNKFLALSSMNAPLNMEAHPLPPKSQAYEKAQWLLLPIFICITLLSFSVILFSIQF